MSAVWISLIVGVVALGAGYYARKTIGEAKISSAELEAERIIADALKDAETKKREAGLESKEELHRMRVDAEREIRDRRQEVQRMERRIVQREEALDKRAEALEKEQAANDTFRRELENQREEIDSIIEQQHAELQRIAGMSADEAREYLLKTTENEIQHEMAIIVKEAEAQAKAEATQKARSLIANAIQRCAADHVAESTVSVVALPSDEMKGRIIGREGRNIRTLETLTGIDLIIDDTPEAVILSGFDPIRREIARIALEKLVADGRIHPARIEEMVDSARKEVDETIRAEGEQATFDTGVHGLHPELIRLLGQLKYRTSYGQNILQHSIEVAHLAGIIASELGIDSKIAKRAGLLHDIGKAVDHEVEGTHVEIGRDMLAKYKESRKVIHAMECHHGDYEPRSLEAVIVTAADAISAARPGARRETLETYIRRLTKLEEIADSFDGVEKAFAIQAGREVRIMVKPDRVDDARAAKMARDIVKRIEKELEYPGQIKVTVIRETRAVDYAR